MNHKKMTSLIVACALFSTVSFAHVHATVENKESGQAPASEVQVPGSEGQAPTPIQLEEGESTPSESISGTGSKPIKGYVEVPLNEQKMSETQEKADSYNKKAACCGVTSGVTCGGTTAVAGIAGFSALFCGALVYGASNGNLTAVVAATGPGTVIAVGSLVIGGTVAAGTGIAALWNWYKGRQASKVETNNQLEAIVVEK